MPFRQVCSLFCGYAAYFVVRQVLSPHKNNFEYPNTGGEAAKKEEERIGKAEPFRTSGGEAAIVRFNFQRP